MSCKQLPKVEDKHNEFKDYSELANLANNEAEEINKNKFKRKLLENACSFANAEGGILWIGISDDGNPVGRHPSFVKNFLRDRSHIDKLLIEYLNTEIKWNISTISISGGELSESDQFNKSENDLFIYKIEFHQLLSSVAKFKKPYKSVDKRIVIKENKIFQRNNSVNNEVEEHIINSNNRMNLTDYPYPYKKISLDDEITYSINEIVKFFSTKILFKELYFYKDVDIMDSDSFDNLLQNNILLGLDLVSVLRSLQKSQTEFDYSELKVLIDKLSGIWRNNILIENIKLIMEKEDFKLVQHFFMTYAVMFEEFFKKISNKIGSLNIEMLNHILDSFKSIEEANFFTVDEDIDIFNPFFKNDNCSVDNFRDNLFILKKIIFNYECKINSWNNNFDLYENEIKLKTFMEKKFVNKRYLNYHNSGTYMKGIFLNILSYRSSMEKFEKIDEIEERLEIFNPETYEEFKMIFDHYFIFISYFNKLLSRNISTVSSSISIDSFLNTERISYFKEVKSIRQEFVKSVVMPLSNMLKIFDIENSEEEKWICNLFWNELRFILHDLDIEFFYIPNEYYNFKSYSDNMKSQFLWEVVESKIWNMPGNSGTTLLKQTKDKIQSNFFDKTFKKEVKNLLLNVSDQIIDNDDIRVDLEKGLYETKDGNKKITSEDFDKFIKNVLTTYDEIVMEFNSKNISSTLKEMEDLDFKK